MRLTLRTLLAYLDDILDPADSQELAEKIKESDYASGLVHRIRSSMGRLRLSSPKVLGKGLGADPNTVAEYLDNTLAVERVPEFEKVCLESDMNLAEVAACHQVLTLVLGEPPTEFSDEMRQRVLSAVQSTSGRPGQPVHGSAAARYLGDRHLRIDDGNSNQHQVPAAAMTDVDSNDHYSAVRYRAPARTWPLAIGLIALSLGFVGTTVLLLATGWFGERGPLAANGNSPATQVAPGNVEPGPVPPAAQNGENVSEPSAQQQPNPNATPVTAPVVAPPLIPESDLVRPADGDVSEPGTTNRESDFPLDPAVPSPARVADAIGSRNLQPARPEAAEAEGSAADGSMDSAPPVAGAPNVNTVEEEAVVGGVPSEPAAPPVRDVGRNISENQALALWHDATGAWQRMPARAAIQVGQRFRGLPTFRPQLALTNGLQITLDGSADLAIGEPNAEGIPRIDFNDGRAIVMGVGQAAGQIIIGATPRELIVKQGDAQSQFAVQAIRTMAPGTDPTSGRLHRIVKVIPLSGSLGIDEPKAEMREVKTGEVWVAIDDRPARVLASGEIPAWVRGEIRDIDRNAMQELEPHLSTERPLTLTLLEANELRRTDVKSLAARCLASLDRFGPSMEALGDRRQHAHWSQHFAQLRQAVHRDPKSSELIKEALDRTKGPDADLLYRMLWGYSPQQLKTNAAAELVQALEHESLEVRVLAIENLTSITEKSLFYRADRPLAKRQGPIKNWQRRLEAREIEYKIAPLMLTLEDESTRPIN